MDLLQKIEGKLSLAQKRDGDEILSRFQSVTELLGDEADFRGANLDGANLTGANLLEADLSGVIGLTPEQIRCARIDPSTKLPDNRNLPQATPLQRRARRTMAIERRAREPGSIAGCSPRLAGDDHSGSASAHHNCSSARSCS